MTKTRVHAVEIDLPANFMHQVTRFNGPPQSLPSDPRFLSAPSVAFTPNVMIASAGMVLDRASLPGYVAAQLAVFQTLPSFALVEQRDVVIGACDGVLQQHRFMNTEGTLVEQLQLYVACAPAGLIASFTCLAGAATRAQVDEYRTALLSLTLVGPS